jgi:hypothetical protein
MDAIKPNPVHVYMFRGQRLDPTSAATREAVEQHWLNVRPRML